MSEGEESEGEESDGDESEGDESDGDDSPSHEKIKVMCPCKDTSHSVSLLGFILLESVDSAVKVIRDPTSVTFLARTSVGSKLQLVQKVAIFFTTDDSPILAALGSRMQRQETMIVVWDLCDLNCRSLAGVKAVHALMNKTMRINWRDGWVWIRRGILLGEEGWTALASGLQRHPGFKKVSASRACMVQAPRAALKIIWDAMGALGTPSKWCVESEAGGSSQSYIDVVKDGVTEGGVELKWEELTEILDMNEAQFLADKRTQLLYESEGDEDLEAEEVDEQAEDGLEEKEQQLD